MPMVQIHLGPKLFEFTSFERWVAKASSWFPRHGATSSNSIAIDAKHRICSKGQDFMRARDEGSFPVAVYFVVPAHAELCENCGCVHAPQENTLCEH